MCVAVVREVWWFGGGGVFCSGGLWVFLDASANSLIARSGYFSTVFSVSGKKKSERMHNIKNVWFRFGFFLLAT